MTRSLIQSHVTESWAAIGALEISSILLFPRNTAQISIPAMVAHKVCLKLFIRRHFFLKCASTDICTKLFILQAREPQEAVIFQPTPPIQKMTTIRVVSRQVALLVLFWGPSLSLLCLLSSLFHLPCITRPTGYSYRPKFGFPENSARVDIPPPPSYDQITPSFPNASAPPYGHYHKGLHKVELDNTFTLPEVVRKRKDDPVTM